MSTGSVQVSDASRVGAPARLDVHVGRWRPPDEAEPPLTEIRNPADTREVVAVAPRAGLETLAQALELAAEGARLFRAVPALERGEILTRAAALLAERVEEAAVGMTREMGKIIAESRAEAFRTVDLLRFFGQAHRLEQGTTGPLPGRHESAFTLRVPIGAVGVITPWNFPLAIPAWKIAAALVYGNAVVFKPAEIAPLSATTLTSCLLEAGLPPSVLSLVLGSGSELGPAIVASPAIGAVSFTGSTEVGLGLARQAAETNTRVQCEMGGRNAIVVLDDADLDAASAAVVAAGFGTAGQRCTSSSRVIVERSVADSFTERLLEAARRLRVGPGLDPETELGPLVSAVQLEGVLDSLDRAVREGGEILYGGERLGDGDLAHGHFMQPTVVRVPRDCWFTGHEVFGPVVAVYKCDGYEDAAELNRAVPYGLTSGIFTRSLEFAERFIRDTDTGMVHVNRPTVGAEAHLPFGGAKASSVGPPEMAAAWQFFTKTRVAHVRWAA